MSNDYLELFMQALSVTTGLVLNFCDKVFKIFVIVVAAALPLFIVFVLVAGVISVIAAITQAVRGKPNDY